MHLDKNYSYGPLQVYCINFPLHTTSARWPEFAQRVFQLVLPSSTSFKYGFGALQCCKGFYNIVYMYKNFQIWT